MDDKRVFLLPGELCVARDPTEIATLLGSCVAICLYNRKNMFGGMTHYMLPHPPAGTTACGKHGDYSIDLLLKMMLKFDNNKSNLEATVLGGASVTGHLTVGDGIGSSNIAMAQTMLERNGICVVRRDVGGDNGRKVYFKNWTGEIEVKQIERSAQSRFMDEKKKDLAKQGVRVLVVDDSATVRKIIIDAISIDPQIQVVGQAQNPYEARELLLETDPDVICLDIIMPKMDGITFLKKLFLYKPKPVIIISTVAQQGSRLRQQAQEIGAVDVIDKEELSLYKGMDVVRNILIPKIKAAATVMVNKKSAEELAKI